MDTKKSISPKHVTFLEIQHLYREESYQYEGCEEINQFLQDCAITGSFTASRLGFGDVWELSGYPGLSRQQMSGLPACYFPNRSFIVEVAKHMNSQTLNLWSEQEQCQVVFKIYENKLQLLFEHLKSILLNGRNMIEVFEQYQHKIKSGEGGNTRAENFTDYYEMVDLLIEKHLEQEKLLGKKPNNSFIASNIAPKIEALIVSGREGFGVKNNVKKRLEKRIKDIRDKQ